MYWRVKSPIDTLEPVVICHMTGLPLLQFNWIGADAPVVEARVTEVIGINAA